MMNVFWVALGGACGATLRYVAVTASQSLGIAFPLGTLLVNVAGSLIIGIVSAYWMSTGVGSSDLKLLFQTGILGAFTTFSAFSLETLLLWQAGHLKAAALNVFLNVTLCLVAVTIGLAMGGVSGGRAI